MIIVLSLQDIPLLESFNSTYPEQQIWILTLIGTLMFSKTLICDLAFIHLFLLQLQEQLVLLQLLHTLQALQL